MTSSQIRCLLALLTLSGKGEKVASKDVADALGVSRPSAHRLLEALVLSGFVAKESYGRAMLNEMGRAEAERMVQHKEALSGGLERVFGIPAEESGLAAVALMCTLQEETLKKIENYETGER